MSKYAFSETEYKWCPQCGGNIRREAYYCRYCRKPIENRLLKQVAVPPYTAIERASEWLPHLLVVKDRCHPDFTVRLRQTSPTTMAERIAQQLAAESNSGEQTLCPHALPEPQTAGLLMDILLSLYEQGESLPELCEEPRLKLLELTPQEVVAENDLRVTEQESGSQCRYCGEFILPASEECRFCQGSEAQAPQPILEPVEKKIDTALLKAVLFYEYAWRKLHKEDNPLEQLFDESTLNSEELAAELARQRAGVYDMPTSRFCRRLFQLNLASYYSKERLSLMEIADLGSSLESKKVAKNTEAQIVLEHALRRTEGKDELMMERSTILNYLCLLFYNKDETKHNLYKAMARSCEIFGMDEQTGALTEYSYQMLDALAKDSRLLEGHPEYHLDQLEAMLSQDPTNPSGNFIGKLAAVLPEGNAFFNAIKSSLSNIVSSSRLSVEAHTAMENEDFETAESKLREALKLESEDSVTAGSNRLTILLDLAQVKRKTNDADSAESILQEGMKLATELEEVNPVLFRFLLSKTRQSLADFLKAAGRYEEAEREFQAIFKLQEEIMAESARRYGTTSEDWVRKQIENLEKYAQLLTVMKREADLQNIESQILRLKHEGKQDS